MTIKEHVAEAMKKLEADEMRYREGIPMTYAIWMESDGVEDCTLTDDEQLMIETVMALVERRMPFRVEPLKVAP